ncbi:MAG: CDP-diacylglycerol--glycerol-3-phosphate 3-phosphatidyltransferase [Eubacteriales bacterium]|nr:CDP-diacylglycerol--glycerol-3-phosphate 3-phosphatidyltransferase [Eubacteriales bacterium]
MSKHIPNIITSVRIALLPFVYLFYLTNFVPYSQYIAIAIFLVAAVTDFLDGKIARKYNLVSNVGKMLDPIADKMLSYTGLFLIIVTGILPLWAAVIVYVINLCRDFAIDCLRMIAATKGTVLAANIFGKIKTTVAFVALPWLLLQGCLPTDWAGLLAFQIIGYVLIGLQTFFCLLSGMIYLIQNRQVLSDVKA